MTPNQAFNLSTRMKMLIMATGMLFFFALATQALTPLDDVLPEDAVSTIECECVESSPKATPDEFAIQKGIYHYRVYIPAGYYETKATHFPCLFIASPGGNAGMGNVSQRMKDEKWIVIMLVESKNGPNAPSIGNFLAAHDDAMQRLRIQNGLKYATGFSGGARSATTFTRFRPGFAGVILQGAGFGYFESGPKRNVYIYDCLKTNKDMAVYAIFGKNDPNFTEVKRLKADLAGYKYLEIELFEGGHTGAPTECMNHAFDWLETQLLNNTSDPKIFEMVLMRRLDKALKIEAKHEKYLVLRDLSALRSKTGKSTGQNEAAQIRQLSEELKKLSVDPEIQREEMAEKAFRQVQAYEKNSGKQKQSSSAKRGVILQSLIVQYQQVAKTYPDTAFGKQAQARAISFQQEAGK